MTKSANIARLRQISELMLDVKLSGLHRAAANRAKTLELLQNLDQPPAQTDLSPVAGYHANLRYQTWAEQRRAQINIVLARQTAELNIARDAAASAFGKREALRSVQEKLR